jgi:uncharacterized protein YaiI (UPF0178 family)
MKILVDADACPVKKNIIKVAKKYDLLVYMFVDTSHIINDGYSRVITVDKSRDSVDIALANMVEKGDIVVTQDYGVAAMVLPKGVKVIDQNGRLYTNENIDKLLFERFLGQKVRRAGARTSGPRKRTKEDDIYFEEALDLMLNQERKIV